jgi:hypothetical protein
LSWGYSFVITINSTLDKPGTVMGFEATDDALIFGLDMRGKVWFKILDPNVLKVVRDNMAREVVLKKKDLSSLFLKVSIPFLNPFLI